MSQNIQDQNRQLGTLRAKGCAKIFNVTECTWWRWNKGGITPKPIKIGPRVTVWKVSEVLAMLESNEGPEAE